MSLCSHVEGGKQSRKRQRDGEKDKFDRARQINLSSYQEVLRHCYPCDCSQNDSFSNLQLKILKERSWFGWRKCLGLTFVKTKDADWNLPNFPPSTTSSLRSCLGRLLRNSVSLSTRMPVCSASRKVDGASSQLKRVLIMYLVDTFMFICTFDEGESLLGGWLNFFFFFEVKEKLVSTK